jgi:HK97 family phage major capsid protein
VIVPSTDELSDDAAVDYWNLVTRELTRAYAKKADEIVFTDERTGGSAGTSGERAGIINLNGVVTKAIAGSTPTWDDLLNTEAKLEDDIDTSNYKWFIRKETWYQLVQTRAGSGFASNDGQGLYLPVAVWLRMAAQYQPANYAMGYTSCIHPRFGYRHLSWCQRRICRLWRPE